MRNRYRKIIAAWGVVTLLSLGTSAVATAQTYTITDLGVGTSLDVTAINNIGQVVGGAATANGESHAFVWQGGVITDLHTLGGANSEAFGINDAGQVVGVSDTANGEQHAALWQKDSQGNYSITDLRTLGGAGSIAFAINAAGQVAGSATTANGEEHAALWQKDSQGNYSITDLRTLGGNHSVAYAINATGQVVGESELPVLPQLGSGFTHAFLWQNGAMRDLGTLSVPVGDLGNTSKAFGINSSGQVVGQASKLFPGGFPGDLFDKARAFLWQNGTITNLDTRLTFVNDDRGLPTPVGDSTAIAINSAGQVVGQSNNFADEIQRAELWQKDSQGAYTITELETLLPAGSGWTRLVTAIAINERGQIVGQGEFNDGLIHRYLLGPSVELLDPVPELLKGPAVTTDPRDKELLASKGRVVQGVAADGVTQLVIRIPAKSVGEQITLTVLNAQQVESASQDEDGAVADVFSPLFRSSVTVTAVDTSKGPMAFALYLAPRDFARTCNSSPCQSDVDAKSREVTLQLQAGNISIKIVRPPVMLIHGLWSGPKAWDDFLLTFNPRFQTFIADYKETNGESIQINTYNVEADLDIDLREFKSVSKVAAVQFDIITHSMGGLIARNLATFNSYRRVSNYRAGDIHKLITLDTPHLGSQLATNLDAASPRCRFVFNLIGKKVGGAVNDLEYGSPAIIKLQQQTTLIKARLIAGQATRFQEVESEAVFRGLTSAVLLGLCSSLLPPGGFPALFKTNEDPDGHSDLIVSVISQLGKTIAVGRQNPPADAPYIEIDGIIHTRIPLLFQGTSATDSPTIGQRVIDLLNTSVATPDFGDILP